MKIAALILCCLAVLSGCGPSQVAKADEKPTAPKETYTAAVQSFRAEVSSMNATLGNTNAELEAIDQRLKSIAEGVAEIKSLLSVENSIAVPVPPAEPPPFKVDAPPKDTERRILFQGKPIDVKAWLKRSVAVVEISERLDVDDHLRDHGLAGDFSGLTRAEKIKLHSVAHSTGVPLKSSKLLVNAAVVLPQSSNCPNGNCARMQYGAVQGRARLFGRWR